MDAFDAFTPLSQFGDWVLLLVRIVMAWVMLYYGLPKFKDLRANAKEFAERGFWPPLFWGTVVALVEVLGGAAILSGFYAWLGAALFGFTMLVGFLVKSLKERKPFASYSYDLLLLALAFVLLAFGSGSCRITP